VPYARREAPPAEGPSDRGEPLKYTPQSALPAAVTSVSVTSSEPWSAEMPLRPLPLAVELRTDVATVPRCSVRPSTALAVNLDPVTVSPRASEAKTP